MSQSEQGEIFFLQEQIAFHRDERCYKRLFFIFYKPLLNFTLSYTKNTEAAEEIVSDILMKMWMMKEGLAGINNLKVYLYRSVKNSALNYLTKHQKYSTVDIDDPDIQLNLELYNPEEVAIKNEFKNKIASAIKSLPPKCQMVYKLVREEGMTYKEVSLILNISENTVDRHLNNALHKLIQAVKVYLY